LLERKGIHHLLEALAKPQPLNVKLIIAGTGSFEPELRALAVELGLSDRVEFLGFVRRDQLPDVYRMGDMFVLPSQTESFGLVFAEAMACGLPIIATRVGGIPDLVRDGTDGLLTDPADVPALRSSIETLLGDAELRRQFGRSARERVERDYSWRSVAEQYLATYQACLTKVAD
jgi:glycogen(starch) synthase